MKDKLAPKLKKDDAKACTDVHTITWRKAIMARCAADWKVTPGGESGVLLGFAFEQAWQSHSQPFFGVLFWLMTEQMGQFYCIKNSVPLPLALEQAGSGTAETCLSCCFGSMLCVPELTVWSNFGLKESPLEQSANILSSSSGANTSWNVSTDWEQHTIKTLASLAVASEQERQDSLERNGSQQANMPCAPNIPRRQPREIPQRNEITSWNWKVSVK